MLRNFYLMILVFFALGLTINIKAQTKTYSDLNEKEKNDFITEKIDEITVKISGMKFAFNSEFQSQVLRFVDSYHKRIDNNNHKKGFGQDLKYVFQRGNEYAPIINSIFDKYGVSRLSGLYISMLESEFDKDILTPTGGSGSFVITTPKARKYGMTKKDIADLSKSAEIAARYLKDQQEYFSKYKMKEFLAVLSWNREPKKINFDLNFKFMSDSENTSCPICGLIGNPKRFDQQFQMESVKYIPKFLAAAIIGENPQNFGLITKPLSTL